MKQEIYSYDDCLTNEQLYQQYKGSQFDIINRAISFATYQVRKGQESHEINIDNTAYDTLKVLADHGLSAFDEK